MSARDTQKSRLYKAERAAGLTPSDTARRLLLDQPRVPSTGAVTIEACQNYVDHLTQSAWFQRRWGRRRFPVRHKAYGSATYTHGWTNWISLPPWARDEWVLLHEVAHGLTEPYAAHGPEFAGVFLTLVEHRMGKAAGGALRAQYKAARVRYTMAAVPKPRESRVRAVDKPVRVPSKAATAVHAAANAERTAKAAAAQERRKAAGFTFLLDDGGTMCAVQWWAAARVIVEGLTGQREVAVLPGGGVERTARGAEHEVRWTARQTSETSWGVWLLDARTGKVRHHASVYVPAKAAG